MDFQHALTRFKFLAHALDGTGGFAPAVSWSWDETRQRQVGRVLGDSYLVRYAREGEDKFASRNAVAVYENHLRSACERYVGFLGRRSPMRAGADGPLSLLMLRDADMRGTDLDGFWRSFALQARARGTMLLVIDKPEQAPASLGQQIRDRAVPYLRMAPPEAVKRYTIDLESGLFTLVRLADKETIGGELVDVEREYTPTGWRVLRGESVVRQGTHAFGACPVLAFTENGQPFPVAGKYAQVADLSRRLFNARSELDEILRGVTFPLLALQVPPEAAATFDSAKTSATIGTHSMVVHSGIAPAFIAPPNGPADVYLRQIEHLQATISRITFEDVMAGPQASSESGVSRKLRFEALNADLATFARQMQALERRMWELFARACNAPNRVEATWPADFNLADVLAELDVLASMQAAGFPPAVLAEKQRAIVAVEFDGADEDTKAALLAAIDEAAQAASRPTGGEGGEGEEEDKQGGQRKPAPAVA